MAIPWAVNAAFATELYLKCLLILEHNAAPPEEHDLKELFRLLPRQTKERLTKLHDQLANRDASLCGWRDECGFKIDLDSLLDQGKDIFALLRYAYEGLPEGISFALNIFTACLKQRILLLHPDWETR